MLDPTMGDIREQTEEICQTCADERRAAGLEPNYLIQLPATLYKELDVFICPTCDGPGN